MLAKQANIYYLPFVCHYETLPTLPSRRRQLAALAVRAVAQARRTSIACASCHVTCGTLTQALNYFPAQII